MTNRDPDIREQMTRKARAMVLTCTRRARSLRRDGFRDVAESMDEAAQVWRRRVEALSKGG